MIRGQTVILHEPTEVGRDAFNVPIYEETLTAVANVLIGEPSTDDITSSMDMYGKRIVYMLGIPKGDAHEWQDRVVSWTDAYGTERRVRTFGIPIVGVEANIPGPWHKKVRCESYDVEGGI